MATIEELRASLQKEGALETTPPPVTQAEQTNPPSTLQKVGNEALAMVRGVEKSFEIPSRVNIPFTDVGFDTGVPENLVEKIEGTINFPVIRGAEIAARLFSNEDYKPDFTTWRQLVNDRVVYTQALRQAAPGTMEGAELGMAAASLPQLLKSGAKLLSKVNPKVWSQAAIAGSKYYARKATKLTNTLLSEGKGTTLDAIINHPDDVIDLVKSGKISNDDIAYDIGEQLTKIKSGLGEKINVLEKNFVTDPTKRVNVVDRITIDGPNGAVELESPLEVIQNFRKSVTSDEGVSILDGKQEANLKKLEEIIRPKVKTSSASIDKGYEVVTKQTQYQPKDISPNDAVLGIKLIDKMINYETAFGAGGVDAKAVQNLLQVRRTLKNQIRGNSKEWFQADEDYANFMELQHGITEKLKKSDSAEGFISNIFGNNKERVRTRLYEALQYGDKVDTELGSADAFYRRLASINAAKKIKNVQLQVSDPIQDKVHRIVNKYSLGGAAVGGKAFQWAGLDPTVGAVVGGASGAYVGAKMANPMRILNAAKKSKDLSTKAKILADDLGYIHSIYGNEGVISFLDVVGPIPAVNEILNFGNPKQKNDVKVEAEKPKYGFPNEEELKNLRWSK